MPKITIRSYLSTFFSNFGIQLATVLQGMMLARMLGAEGRGAYATVLIWPTLFAGIGLFGTNIALSRYSAKNGAGASAFKTALVAGLTTGGICSLLCFLLLPLLLKNESIMVLQLTKIFVPYILINHLIMNLGAVYWGCADFKRFNFIFICYYPFFLLGLVVCFYAKISDIQSFIYLTLFCNIIVLILASWGCRKQLLMHGAILPIKEFIKSSLPFGITALLQNAIIQVDRIVVLYCLGVENLGFYVVALSAGSALSSIGTATGQVIFSHSAQQEAGKGFSYIVYVFKSLSIIYLFLGGGLLLLMPWLLPLVYGAEFSPAVGTACILIPGFICSSLSNFLEQSIRGQGVAFKGAGARIAVLLFMLILGMIFCRNSGLAGMGIAYFLAQFLGLILLVGISVRHYQDGCIKKFIPSFSEFISLYQTGYNILLSKVRRP